MQWDIQNNIRPAVYTKVFQLKKKAQLWEAWWSNSSDSILMLCADRVWRFIWASQIAVTGAGEQVVPQLAEASHS